MNRPSFPKFSDFFVFLGYFQLAHLNVDDLNGDMCSFFSSAYGNLLIGIMGSMLIILFAFCLFSVSMLQARAGPLKQYTFELGR